MLKGTVTGGGSDFCYEYRTKQPQPEAHKLQKHTVYNKVTENPKVMTSVTNLTHNVIHTSAVHHFQMQLCLKGKVGFKKEFNVGCESCFSLLSFLTPGLPGINTQIQTC